MPARSWFPFYPSDWRGDPRLRACSAAEKGLWIDLLCIMSEAVPFGHLLVASHPPTDDELARQVGMAIRELRACLGGLERRQVFSRTVDGIIYSRRMVRDEAVRLRRAAGGNDSLNNPNVPRPKDILKDTHKDILPPVLEGSTQIPDTIYHTPNLSTSTKTSAIKSRVTWLTPYFDLWKTRLGGLLPSGQAAKYLRPLEAEHGQAKVLLHLGNFLAEYEGPEARFASIGKFASTFGQWNGVRRATRQARNEAAIDQWAAEEERKELTHGEP